MIKKMISAAAFSFVIGACAMAQTQPVTPKDPSLQAQPVPAQPVQVAPADATPQTAPAQSPKPVNNIHERQEKQQQRIGEGVESGKLTPEEAKRLENREAQIQKEKKAAKTDGKVTKKEKKAITTDQNKTSNAINKQKHDDQKMKESKTDDKK